MLETNNSSIPQHAWKPLIITTILRQLHSFNNACFVNQTNISDLYNYCCYVFFFKKKRQNKLLGVFFLEKFWFLAKFFLSYATFV